MKTTDEALRLFAKKITAGQKKDLAARARALSLMQAAKRAALAKREAARVKTENAALMDMGLASPLTRAPFSGTDEAARRTEGFVSFNRALAAGETAALKNAAQRMARETALLREEEKRKKARATQVTASGVTPERTRTVTVRKI